MKAGHKEGSQHIVGEGFRVSLTLGEWLLRAYPFSMLFQGAVACLTLWGVLLPFLALAVSVACLDPIVRSFGLHLGLELKGL